MTEPTPELSNPMPASVSGTGVVAPATKKKIVKTQIKVNDSQSKPKQTDYRCYNLPEIRQIYPLMLNDNLDHLINYIYNKSSVEPYNSPAVRVGLSMQMLLASNKLISYQLSSLIIKDIEELRKNEDYLSKWANPVLKRKALLKEIELLKKHTEIDETMSLNLVDNNDNPDEFNGDNLKDFDLESNISTLNVSSQFPVESQEPQKCTIM